MAKTNIFVLARRLKDVLKTSSEDENEYRLQDVDVFIKTNACWSSSSGNTAVLGYLQQFFLVVLWATLSFFYRKLVYKQLALGWQIAKELSGLNILSLSNNENHRVNGSGIFPL